MLQIFRFSLRECHCRNATFAFIFWCFHVRKRRMQNGCALACVIVQVLLILKCESVREMYSIDISLKLLIQKSTPISSLSTVLLSCWSGIYFFCRRWSQQNANSFFPIRWMYIFLQLVLKFCERLCKTKLIVANFPLKKKLYYKSFNWIMCAIMKWSNTKLATLNFIEIGFR